MFFACYFTCILDFANDVRQKAKLSSFLIWVQNGSENSGDNLTASIAHLAW